MGATTVRWRPNIAFAGLTAAGKTTHAKLLAQALGYRYISATEILLQLLGIASAADRAWFDQGERIQYARAMRDVDAELDRRLTQLASDQDGLVIDSWAVPWTCRAPMIRLWIESDTRSRIWKCFVSQGGQPEHDLRGCGRLVAEKDSSTRDFFLRRHGFDLFTSREVFDAILDNTHLIRQPSRQAADAGIATFGPVVEAVATSLLNNQPYAFSSVFSGWTRDQRHCVTHVNRSWKDGTS